MHTALQSALLSLLLSAVGCKEPVAPGLPALRPVVATEIARLSALVAAPALPPLDAKHASAPRGLLELIQNSSGSIRSAGWNDLLRLGDGLLPALANLAADQSLDPDLRGLALEGIWRFGSGLDAPPANPAPVGEPRLDPAPRTRAAAQELEALLTTDLPWMRARCAWYLGHLGLDRCLPSLALRLKYEVDSEAVIWIAWALARFGNFAGLLGLEVIGNPELGSAGATPELQNQARAVIQALVNHLGVQDGPELMRLWNNGDPERRLPHLIRSPEAQLELWRWIARLDEFQLRGVDDVRFLFERMDESAAPPLAEALSDQSAYVRLHAVQCLGRMGRRAAPAASRLLEALEREGLAPYAAEALGAIGYPPARTRLEALLSLHTPLELQVASARALGHLGLAESQSALAAAFDQSPESPELRQALLESLIYLRDEPRALKPLLALLDDPTLELSSTYKALHFALQQQAASGDPAAQAALQTWTQLDKTELTPSRQKQLLQALH